MTNANHKRNISINSRQPFISVDGNGRLFFQEGGRAAAMEERDLLFALHEMKGVGWKTIEMLFLAVRPFDRLLQMEEADLTAIGIPQAKAKTIRSELSVCDLTARKEAYAKYGVDYVTVFDKNYPHLLRHSSQPPWVLYYKGDIRLLGANSIAIVGTRTPTPYGRKVAEMLARSLSERSLCVVSGLARGIDTCAHVGALEGNGGTIAVLGTGPERIYPPENGHLFQQIAERGLIVTEYPLGTAVSPGLFPRRNRIIAALSHGTVVVEAARRSGSLITADLALEESRDVFAVPGPITSEKSLGTLDLIRQGAKIVTGVEDILSEYEGRIEASATTEEKRGNSGDLNISPDERKVLSYLSDDPVTFDRLLEFTQFSFGHLHSVLLSLHMKKKIEHLPGSRYISV